MYAPKITMLGRPPVFIRNMETFVRNFIWESGILRILDLSFEKCVLDLTFVVKRCFLSHLQLIHSHQTTPDTIT